MVVRAGAEAANPPFGLQPFYLDRLGELIDRDVPGFIADFQPQIDLPRTSGIIRPKVLTRVGQARGNRREWPFGTVADRQRNASAAKIGIFGLPADVELARRLSLSIRGAGKL